MLADICTVSSASSSFKLLPPHSARSADMRLRGTLADVNIFGALGRKIFNTQNYSRFYIASHLQRRRRPYLKTGAELGDGTDMVLELPICRLDTIGFIPWKR